MRALLVGLVLAGGPAGAEVIDRVLAVVGGRIITLSDARAALRLGLVPPDVSPDPTAAVLNRLIERQLIVAEVDRYGPPEPSAAAVDERVAAIERRLGGAQGLKSALEGTAMSYQDLRLFVRDTLRVEAYLEQRFASVIEPSPGELVRFYRDNPGDFTTEGTLPPFDAVRERVRERALEARRAAAVREWVDGLRRRAALFVLYLPEGR